ncbi:Protein of unknown function [Gryllus bimaculatus]|nr:Protein of unknown function [Gryllus bimaculatus]
MKCSYACVVCVLSFIAGFLCLLTSAAVVIFAIWIWVTHDCVLDPEGIYVFQIIRAITVILLVLLSVETIASGLLLAGIIKWFLSSCGILPIFMGNRNLNNMDITQHMT